MNSMDDLMKAIVFVICHIVYMFSTNYAGQKFMDYAADVYQKMWVMKTKWQLGLQYGYKQCCNDISEIIKDVMYVGTMHLCEYRNSYCSLCRKP